MDTLEYIASIENDGYLGIKEKINLNQKSPIEIPNTNRKNLARLFRKLGFKVGVELGVEAGVYSECLVKCNPDAEIYLIDPWKAYKGYREYVTQSKIDSFYEELKERLKPYDNYKIIRKFSMDAVKDFKDKSLDFVYIDANHMFEYVAQDIGFWTRKVRKGGIVSGHDYIKRSRPTATHVVQALQGYVNSHGIKPWFILGSRAKTPGVVRERARSWFFVKP